MMSPMGTASKGDRRQINATVPEGMLEVIDEHVFRLGFATRTDYTSALIDGYLDARERPRVELVPAPVPPSFSNAKARVATVRAAAFTRAAKSLGTTPSTLLRSLIYRDLGLDAVGVYPAVSGQGVLDVAV